jgi:hypothetical protein
VICNSALKPIDVHTAKAASVALWKSWAASAPEALLDEVAKYGDSEAVRLRFQRLYNFLSSGKLEVRVLPDRTICYYFWCFRGEFSRKIFIRSLSCATSMVMRSLWGSLVGLLHLKVKVCLRLRREGISGTTLPRV